MAQPSAVNRVAAAIYLLPNEPADKNAERTNPRRRLRKAKIDAQQQHVMQHKTRVGDKRRRDVRQSLRQTAKRKPPPIILFQTGVNDRIKYRQQNNLSQEELANLVGVTRQTINMIEKGNYNPTLNLCISICKVLDKTLDEIFWEDENNENK